MIFDFFLLLVFQPFFPSIFFFLPPLLYDFFKENLKKLNVKIFLYSFLTDLIFLKPLGFFLLLASFSLFLISLLEKFLTADKFYQRLIFLLVFNFIFFLSFLYLSSLKSNWQIFFKVFFFNFFWQIIYLEIKRNFLAND